MPVDYSKGQIYTIRSHQTDAIYIGSTCGLLHKRLSGHKKHYKLWMKGKYNYVTSYEIVKYDDAYIELLEDVPCDSKKELNRREGQLIRQHDCVNKRIAGQTLSEWYQDNKDYCISRAKTNYAANKDKVLQRHAERVTCECGAVVSYGHVDRHMKTERHQVLMAEKSHTNSYNQDGVDQASEDTDP